MRRAPSRSPAAGSSSRSPAKPSTRPSRESVPDLVWTGHIDIDELPLLSSDQRDLSLRQLEFLIVNEGFGQRPADLYRTWLYNRIAASLTPILCLSLVVALAQRFHRIGDFGYLMFTGLIFGFAFFVLDGATLAMGEAALLPPWFAAGPPRSFSSASLPP